MAQTQQQLRTLRHRLGAVREWLQNHIFSLRRTIVFEADCRSDTIGVARRPVTFRQGDAADLSAFAGEQNGYGEADMKFCYSRLSDGDSLFIAEVDDAPVMSGWLMCAQMDLDQNAPLLTRPEVAYSYKLLTLHHARGLRICSAYYSFLKAWLLSRGYTRLICRITPDNMPSIRAHARAGFRPVGVLRKLVLGPWAFYFADADLRNWLRSVTVPQDHVSEGVLLKTCRT